jgi:hypothetical protein
MTTLLGANWRTSITGLFALVTGAISFKPSLVNFLPQTVQLYVVGISNFAVFISAGSFAWFAKDKNVTGAPR